MAYNAALAARLPGRRFEVSLTDRSGRVQNLYAVGEDITRAMQQAMQVMGAETYEIAYALTPKDTWFMADHLRLDFSPNYQVFELGWSADDFFDADLPFYPPYVVFGTRFMAGQDPLTPAHEMTKPEYEATMRELVNAAMLRRRVGP
jgi:hypothetical protein